MNKNFKEINQYYKIIKTYLIFIFILTFFFLCALNQSLSNQISEWVINYQGGFSRRGLTGEIFYQIAILSKINLRLIILFFEIIFSGIYFYLIYKFTKNIKFIFVDLFIFFSPIFLFYPLAEFEALGRKEIIFFIFIVYFFDNLKNKNILYFLIFFILPLIIFIYEAVIFYLLFIVFALFLEKDSFKNYRIFKIIIFFIPAFMSTLIIMTHPQTMAGNERMCLSLATLHEQCGLASAFTTHNIQYHMQEVSWRLKDIVKYLLVLLIGFLPMGYLVSNCYFNKKIINDRICNIPFILTFFFLLVTTFIMYFVAVDSARWTVMSYTTAYFFVYGLIKSNYVIAKTNTLLIKLNKYFLENKKIFFVLILIFGFSWNLKPVNHEGIGSIPLYRTIIKLTKPHWYKWNLKLTNK